jgi:hypothetical protein
VLGLDTSCVQLGLVILAINTKHHGAHSMCLFNLNTSYSGQIRRLERGETGLAVEGAEPAPTSGIERKKARA